MRSAQSHTVERLESRCVLSAVGPDLPPSPAPLHVEAAGPPPVTVAPMPGAAAVTVAVTPVGSNIVTQPAVHGVVVEHAEPAQPMGVPPTLYMPGQASYAPGSFNSAPTSSWGREPVVTYVVEEITIIVQRNPGSTYGYDDSYYESPSHPEYRPPAKSVPIVALEGITNSASDTAQNVTSEHAKSSEASLRDQSGQSEAAVNRTAANATNQPSYTAAPWVAHSASLMPTRAATQLLELIFGKQFLPSNGAKSADGSQAGADSAASRLVHAGMAGLAGAEMFVDLVHGGLPLLAEMPMNPSVQKALDAVMADIKLIGTEVSEWIGSVRVTPTVLAVTAATAGAGAAVYLRRRKGRETGNHDDEASSSWLFARLQTIPLQ